MILNTVILSHCSKLSCLKQTYFKTENWEYLYWIKLIGIILIWNLNKFALKP